MSDLQLDRQFDVVLMAGNVPLFTPPGTQAGLVAGCVRHVRPGGRLVCGFQLDRGYGLADYDDHCRAAGLELEARWATWDRAPFEGGDYAVSVHRPASSPPPARIGAPGRAGSLIVSAAWATGTHQARANSDRPSPPWSGPAAWRWPGSVWCPCS
jgi:hypothetical protein